MICAARRGRRQVGPGRASPSSPARSWPPASWSCMGIQMTYLPVPGTTIVLDATSRIPALGPDRRRDDQRGELRRRPRRPAGRDRADRGAGLLLLHLPALRSSSASTARSRPSLFSALLAGMCLGFLPHNFYPARIFMGDSGSMLIGLVLAASTVSFAGQIDFGAVEIRGRLTGAAAADPAVRGHRRAVPGPGARGDPPDPRGRSPFAPDKQHLHHRLLEIGHSHRGAVLIMYFWSALIAFGVVGLSLLSARRGRWSAVAVARGRRGRPAPPAARSAGVLAEPASPSPEA